MFFRTTTFHFLRSAGNDGEGKGISITIYVLRDTCYVNVKGVRLRIKDEGGKVKRERKVKSRNPACAEMTCLIEEIAAFGCS